MAPEIPNNIATYNFDPSGVPHLPPEILYTMGTFMDIATIKATRLASCFMADTLAPFVLDKVWISSAKEDQIKLREISEHPTARFIVREIAYDSTVYCGSLLKLSEYLEALSVSNTLANSTYHHGRFGNTSRVTYTEAAVKRGHNVFKSYYTEQRELILRYQCQHFTQNDMEMIDLPGVRGRGNLPERLASIDRTGLTEVIQDMSVIPSLLEHFAPDLRCLLETLPLMPYVRRFSITDQRWTKDQRRRWTRVPDEVVSFPKDKSFIVQRNPDTGNRRGYDAVVFDPRPWPSGKDKLPRGSHLPTWYRGFWILTQVASMLKFKQLKSFTIDADGYRNSSGISHTVFCRIDPIRLQHTVNAFKYLTTLKMEINTHEKDPWTDFPATLASGNIAKMLCAADRLQSLDLAFDAAETQITDLDTLLGRDHIWPQLTALTLTNMCLHGDQWAGFLTRQGVTLQKLSIIKISFSAPENSWPMMFATFEAMALEHFFIAYLKEKEDHTDEAPSLRTGRISGSEEIKRLARAIAADEMSL